MLPLTVVQEIQRLLDEGELSQRQISRRLKVSRGTVSSVANGKRSIYARRPAVDATSTEESLSPQRCPGCGAMVYLPCILCRARNYARRKHLLHLLEQLSAENQSDPRQVA